MPRALRILLAAAPLVLCTPASALVTVTLSNGDHLRAELISESEDEVHVRHPALGELLLPRDSIRALVHGDLPGETRPSPTITALPDRGLLGSGWLTDWRRRMELGVSGAAGTASNQQGHAGFSAEYEDTRVRWKHRTRVYRSEAEGEVNANSLELSLNRDGLQPGSPWFHFAGGRFDRDDFQPWERRLNVNGGLGYQFAATPSWRLLGRTGLGGSRFWGGAVGDDFEPEWVAGLSMDWKLSAQQGVSLANTYHRNLDASALYRNITTLDWTVDLDRSLGVGLKIGVTNEYDAGRDSGLDRNDFKYTSALVWRL